MNDLTKYTFKDTGKTVEIRKVSPLLALQLRKDFPPPEPPLVEVTLGESGQPELEANPADPDYQRRLVEYEQDFNMKSQQLMIKRGVVVDVTVPEVQAEITALRNFYRDEFGRELPKDDQMVYVSMICIGTQEDMAELIDAIMRRSQPTEAAVKNAANSFPGQV